MMINHGHTSSGGPHIQLNEPNLTSNEPTFSNVLNGVKLPTKEDAIVLDSVDGLSIHSYTLAIGKIIEPKNILFASRISQNRVCLYLKDKSFVDNLVNENNKIKIEDNSLEVRRLVARNTRIIISNACPIIPNDSIEEALKGSGFRIASRMTYIRGGNKTPGYEHICSFRRQVYVKSEDVQKIPPSVKIEFDDTTYWAYFSKDKVQCFLCKEEGHIAKYCKASDVTENSIEEENLAVHEPGKEFPVLPPPKVKSADGASASSPNVNTCSGSAALPSPVKREYPDSLASNSTTKTRLDSRNNSRENNFRRVSKKKKIRHSPSLSEITTAVDEVNSLLETDKKIAEQDALLVAKFLVESFGVRNVREIAAKFTNDLDKFLEYLYLVRVKTTNVNLKKSNNSN